MRPKRRRRSSPPTHPFPMEVLPDILARLPVKTLMQCRSVCSNFCSIIDSPQFASKQLKMCKENRMNTHILTQERPIMWDFEGFVLRRSDTFRKTGHLEFETPVLNHYYEIMQGFVNGLVLMQMVSMNRCRQSVGEVIILWNPSVRKHVTFTPPQISFDHLSVQLCFGFDPISNDYKLSIICFPYCFQRQPVRLYIARLNNNPTRVWTNKTIDGFNWYGSGKCVYLDGHVYMTGCANQRFNPDQNRSRLDTHLIAFDLANELLTCPIELPPLKRVNTSNIERALTRIGESSIALFDFGTYDYNNNKIWVLEKCNNGVLSWSQMYKFELCMNSYIYIGEKSLVLFESGGDSCQGILSYKLDTVETKCVAKTGTLESVTCFGTYEESLVLFGLTASSSTNSEDGEPSEMETEEENSDDEN